MEDQVSDSRKRHLTDLIHEIVKAANRQKLLDPFQFWAGPTLKALCQQQCLSDEIYGISTRWLRQMESEVSENAVSFRHSLCTCEITEEFTKIYERCRELLSMKMGRSPNTGQPMLFSARFVSFRNVKGGRHSFALYLMKLGLQQRKKGCRRR